MENALDLSIHGIKCDNIDCDFVDMEVKVEDYDKWLNKPCPKCGTNLLTQEDFDNTQLIISLVNTMNKILPQDKNNEGKVEMNIEMDGTGEMNFKI